MRYRDINSVQSIVVAACIGRRAKPVLVTRRTTSVTGNVVSSIIVLNANAERIGLISRRP